MSGSAACCGALAAVPAREAAAADAAAHETVAAAAHDAAAETLFRAFSRLGYLGEDFRAMLERDPALGRRPAAILEALSYAGFWAILFHRIAHLLAALRVPLLPRFIQAFARLATGVDIHPGARLGAGLFIDHGMGTVIGETAWVGRGVTLLQQVTLGGRGARAVGKRHPTVGDGAFIGAGAKVLGPILVGSGARVGANAVVLSDVPAGATAVGVPARIARR